MYLHLGSGTGVIWRAWGINGKPAYDRSCDFSATCPLLAVWRKLLLVCLVSPEAGFLLLGTGSLTAPCSQSLKHGGSLTASGSFLPFKLSCIIFSPKGRFCNENFM